MNYRLTLKVISVIQKNLPVMLFDYISNTKIKTELIASDSIIIQQTKLGLYDMINIKLVVYSVICNKLGIVMGIVKRQKNGIGLLNQRVSFFAFHIRIKKKSVMLIFSCHVFSQFSLGQQEFQLVGDRCRFYRDFQYILAFVGFNFKLQCKIWIFQTVLCSTGIS